MSSSAIDSWVKPARKDVNLIKRRYKTKDIVQLTLEVEQTDRDDTEKLALQFKPTYEGLRALFEHCAERFTYSEDPTFNQWVQTPSYLYHTTKKGDCKSFTVFISSVLHNMGLKRVIAFTHYNRAVKEVTISNVKHVYPIAILPSGQKVPMDLAYYQQEGGQFGTEKPYKKKIQYLVDTKQGLYKLGNTQTDSALPPVQSLDDIIRVAADIPDTVITSGPGDITRMTSGQLDRYLMEDRLIIQASQATDEASKKKYVLGVAAIQQGSVAGIGSSVDQPFIQKIATFLDKTARDNRPAFGKFEFAFQPVGINGGLIKKIGKGLKKFGKKVGNVAKKVGKAVAMVFKKFINWLFKGAAKLMAPYFLFLWIKKRPKNREVSRRMTEQKKTYDWIRKTAKIEDSKLRAVMANGIKEKTRFSPQEILDRSAGHKISGFAALAVIMAKVVEAVAVVIKVVKKIIGLFKKKKSNNIDKGNMSDLALLEGEAAPGGGTAPGGGLQRSPTKASQQGSGGGGLLMASAMAAGIYLLS